MTTQIKLDASVKAANRRESFEILKTVFDQTDFNDCNTIELTRQQWQALYLYFAPKAPAKAKTPEQWAAKAVAGKNEPRDYLKYLYSDGERLIGCDGHRAHIVRPDGAKYPAGYYDPKTLRPVDMSAKYPDIDRVIPDRRTLTPEQGFALNKCDLIDIDGKTQARKLETDNVRQWFNNRYLEAAANGSERIYMALTNDPKRQTVQCAQGYSEHGVFIIMPANITD